jgi:hypothetical protein
MGTGRLLIPGRGSGRKREAVGLDRGLHHGDRQHDLPDIASKPSTIKMPSRVRSIIHASPY